MDISLGERIKKLRREHNISDSDLASKINIDINTLANIESDKAEPALSTLLSIAKVFNVTTDYLIIGSSNDTITLDDMNEDKRLDYICKNDDLDSFIKYNYIDSFNLVKNGNRNLDKHAFPYAAPEIWRKLFDMDALNIFKYSFEGIIKKAIGRYLEAEESREQESYRQQYTSDVAQYNKYIMDPNHYLFTTVFDGNYNYFINFCLNHDLDTCMKALGCRYSSSYSEGILEARNKAPKCFKYYTSLDEEEIVFNNKKYIIPDNKNGLLPLIIKYKYYDLLDYYLDYNMKLLNEVIPYTRDLPVSVDNHEIRLNLGRGNYFLLGYFMSVPEEAIELLAKDKNRKLCLRLLEYNDKVNKLLANKYPYSDKNQAYYIDEVKLDKLIIDLDDKISEYDKIVKKIKLDEIVDLESLNSLMEIDSSYKTLDYCKKIINSKSLTLFELIYKIKYCNYKEPNEAYKNYSYEDLMNLTKYRPLGKRETYLERKERMSFFEPHVPHKSSEIIENIDYRIERESYGDRDRFNVPTIYTWYRGLVDSWIDEMRDRLGAKALSDKMLKSIKNITKDYIKSLIKKDAVELAIIKLSIVLQAKLTIALNYEGELSELLDMYIEKHLMYFDEDHDCDEEEPEARILRKLVSDKENIVNPRYEKEYYAPTDSEIDFIYSI